MPRGRSGPSAEVRAFRRWVSEETVRQLRGDEPTRYPIAQGNDERDWLWEHAPCGYAHATPDGRLVHVNNTLLNWLGLDASNAYELSFADLLDDVSRDALFSELRPALRSSGRIEDAKVTLMCADGAQLAARVSALFERDEKGEPAGIRAVIDVESRPPPQSDARELELLQALQRTLIPAVPPAVPGLEVAVRYHPAVGEVGGDFFDIFEVVEDDWCVVLGDVSGKGIEAGIVTAEARHTVRSAALREPTPRGLLGALNRALYAEEQTRFCTVALARLQLSHDACVATISVGGHPFPLLVRHGTVTPMGRAGSLLGAFDEVAFHDVSIRLASGDSLVLYTDGVTEARDEFGQFFGEERMHAAIVTGGPSADEIADSVVESVLEFRTGSADDIALVVIRRP
jgi:sigma-B regulation protein RsbU (phosphoserine phosphatase)